MAEDQSYIKGLLTNDKTVMNEIYNAYYPRIQAMVKRNGGGEEDAWEVFQEALILIFQKAQIPDFQLTSSFYSFLFGICKFKWNNERKKKSRKNVTIDGRDTYSNEDGIEEGMIAAEQMELYKSKFAELGDDCQKILHLFFSGEKFKNIAKKLNFTSENSVKKKKHLCQKKLIQMIQEDQRFNEI